MSSQPTIAVLGASANRSKFSNKCVRAYLEAGYEVFPVNPREEEIEGRRVFKQLAEIPSELDRISVYLPPVLTMELLPEIVAKGAGEVYFNPGSADRRVLDAARTSNVNAVAACSIKALGMTPEQFPD